MSDYPDLPITQAVPEPDAGVRTTPAMDGTVRQSSEYAETLWRWTITHQYLSASERTTLWDHYVANQRQAFTVTLPEGDYTVRYQSAPRIQPIPGLYYTATVQVIGYSA